MYERLDPATRIFEEIWASFARTVPPRLGEQRDGQPLREETLKRIEKGRAIDVRPPLWLTVSGKGGPDHQEWMNVTLLDHSLSVARGAALLFLYDTVLDRADVLESPEKLRRWAALLFAVGFSHDLDKMLARTGEQMGVEAVAAFLGGSGLEAFLKAEGVELCAKGLWELIATVEDRTDVSFVSAGASQVGDAARSLVARYVKAADGLDGEFLRGSPADAGNRLLDRLSALARDRGVFSSPDFFRQWRALTLEDPHHPFLMDLLQRQLSIAVDDICGCLPMVELVHDGKLMVLVPAHAEKEILDQALSGLAAALPFESTVVLSTQGKPSLSGAIPASVAELETAISGSITNPGFSRIMAVKKSLVESFGSDIRALIEEMGWAMPATTGEGALVQLAVIDGDQAPRSLRRALLLSFLAQVDEEKKSGAPTVKERQQQLAEQVDADEHLLAAAMEAGSQTAGVILALLVTKAAREDADVEDAVFGSGGLVEQWVIGGLRSSLFAGRRDRASQVRAAVRQRFAGLLAGEPLEVLDDTFGMKHCIITGEPVPEGEAISQADMLYGIKSSAMSYREGRSESKTAAKGETHISPSSFAEYRLRTDAIRRAGLRGDSIPLLVSSPSVSGLFGGVLHAGADETREFNSYSMLRQEIKDGARVFRALESYEQKVRISRFEDYPQRFMQRSDGKSDGRLNFILRMLKAARRLGRPVHVFRGLPTYERAFFFMDSMDPEIEEVLGARSLRIEDMGRAIDRLTYLAQLGEAINSVELIKRVCSPTTRFLALAEAWSRLRSDESANAGHLMKETSRWLVESIKEDQMPNEGNEALELARLALRIQRAPLSSASANEESWLFREAMEALETLRGTNSSRDQMAAAVAGHLRETVRRHGSRLAARDKRPEGATIQDAIADFTDHFLDKVWLGVFDGRHPDRKILRGVMSAYRWALVDAGRKARKDARESAVNLEAKSEDDTNGADVTSELG